MKTVLTIAGSDSSGGAGIQADIKTITMHGLYAMSAITALTAQNTTGVYGILDSTEEFLASQLDCIFTDIYPDAVKIGMVSHAGLIHTIGEKLKEYKAKNVVLDPVMVSTSGFKLLKDEAAEALMKELMPRADVITPNIPEAEVLSGMDIEGPTDMEKAAAKIAENYGGAVLVKGGHETSTANDFLFAEGKAVWFKGSALIIVIPMGQDVPYPPPLPATLQKEKHWRMRWDMLRSISQGHCWQALTWGKGPGR